VARNEKRNTGDVDMTAVSESRVLGVADPELQTSLQSEVEPDPMEGEQTWPTEEELAEAEEQAKQKTKMRCSLMKWIRLRKHQLVFVSKNIAV